MMPTRVLSARDWLMLALLGLALFLPGLASLPPVDRDEARYAVASQRMADTGDFIDIRFQDEPRYLQPAGIYWLQALSTIALDSPAHDSIWAYRVPSLLAALAAVLMTGGIGAWAFGRKAGMIAAALLAASFSLNFEARIAKTDAMLLASIVTAQLALMRAYVGPAPSRAIAALFWAALGVGLMVKGPIILIVIGATILTLVAWDRRFSWLRNLRPVWGPLLTLAIAGPWYVAIGYVSDGGFYARAIGQSLMGKVASSQQGHSGPLGYHLALFLFAFWPGCLLALRAIPFAWRERGQPAVRFLLCWLAPTWVIFEFVATKLPHYVLPTYPAIACLAAAALFDSKTTSGPITRVAFFIVSVLWLGASALLAAAGPVALHLLEHTISPLSISLAVASFAAACACLWTLSKKRYEAAAIAVALSAVLAWTNVFGFVAPRLNSMWLSPRIAAAAQAAMPCETSVLVTTPYSEPSLVFLNGRTRTNLAATGAEAAQTLAREQDCGLALVGAEQRDDFLATASSLHMNVRPLGEIAGRNYSNGANLNLIFYGAAPTDSDGR